MESYIIRREEHTTDKPFYALKEDLILMAKQQAFEMGANAIIQAKLSITRGNRYITLTDIIYSSSTRNKQHASSDFILLQNGNMEDGLNLLGTFMDTQFIIYHSLNEQLRRHRFKFR